jgi:hypothetical protein
VLGVTSWDSWSFVITAFQAAGGFARVEAGSVFTNEDMAHDESDKGGAGVVGAAFGTLDCWGELPSGVVANLLGRVR